MATKETIRKRRKTDLLTAIILLIIATTCLAKVEDGLIYVLVFIALIALAGRNFILADIAKQRLKKGDFNKPKK